MTPRGGRPLLLLALVAAMAAWGVNMSTVKVLTAHFDAMPLAAWRMAIAGVALTAMAWMKGGPLPRPGARQWGVLLLCAFCMVYGYQFFLVTGLEKTTATNASLIVALIPLVTTAMAALWYRERPRPSVLCGIALALAGVSAAVLVRPGAGWAGLQAGDALLLLAVASFAGGGVMIQSLSPLFQPLQLVAATHVLGALMLAAHAGLGSAETMAARPFQLWPWLLIGFSGVVAAALGNLVWYQSIARIGAARTAPALYLVPLFGIAFAVLFLGESFSPWHPLALAAVVAGSRLAMRSPRGQQLA